MTQIDLGKVMLTFKGDFAPNQTYDRLDAVTYQGASYVCLSSTTTTPPSADWQLLAKRGTDGKPGSDGLAPHIDGVSGNWFIGTTDTGQKAQGDKGDQGDRGLQGPQGTPGNPGDKGDPGPAGKSAYQVAVDNGYTGTKSAWLASLKGPKGDPGTTPDTSSLATKMEVQAASEAASQASQTAQNNASQISALSGRVDAIKAPDLSDYVTKADLANQHQITHDDLFSNKNPSDYPGGFYYEVKWLNSIGIDRSKLDTSAQGGYYGLLTTKSVDYLSGYAFQRCELLDAKRPLVYVRNGSASTWSDWELVTTW